MTISRRLYNICYLLAVFVFAIAFFSCKQNEHNKSCEIIDTKMWTGDGGGKYKWIDNENVLFPSNDTLLPQNSTNKMCVWNTKTRQVKFLGNWLPVVCSADDGELIYTLADKVTNKPIYYKGPPENIIEYKQPRDNMYFRNDIVCDWVDNNNSIGRSFDEYLIVMRGGNYIKVLNSNNDFEAQIDTQTGNRKAVYFSQPGVELGLLPFLLDGKDDYRPEYIRWKNAYLISPNHYHPDRLPKLWWLERDGRTQEIPLPKTLHFPNEGSIHFLPTPNGIFVHYNGGDLIKDRGGYFITKGGIEKIFNSSGGRVELSPDGREAVFDHTDSASDYYSIGKKHRTLKLIKFGAVLD